MVKKTIKKIHHKVRETHESLDKNVSLALLVALGVLLWMATGLFSTKEETAMGETQTPLKTVAVQALEKAPYTETITLATTLQAKDITMLRAQTSGRVVAVHQERGTFVKKGTLLIELDAEDKKEALSAAKATLKEAQTLYTAAKKLNKEGYRAKTALETQKAQLEDAKRRVKEAEDNLSFAQIRAPFDGYFDDRLVALGTVVSTGEALGILFSTQAYQLEGFISQKDRHLARVGKPAQFTLTNGQTGIGTVSFVSAYGDTTTKTYRILIDVQGKEEVLPLNMSATAILSGDTHPAALIPYSALVLNDIGHLGVMVVDLSNTVSFHAIDPLADAAEGYYIQNTPAQARLILKGQHNVQVGEKVMPENMKEGDPS